MTGDNIPIGTFSYITHLSQKALRIYDEKGLPVPSERDLCTGFQYYMYNRVERGMFLRNPDCGEFAAVFHTWPYYGVSAACEKLFAYPDSENLIPAGPTRELYINDPAQVPEDELLTGVMIPVKKV